MISSHFHSIYVVYLFIYAVVQLSGCVLLFTIPWTEAHRPPIFIYLFMGNSN